jgi:hypothetical protein
MGVSSKIRARQSEVGVSERLIVVVASLGVSPGKCKYCGGAILWATTASRPGHPAKTVPWNRPRPWPTVTPVRNDETGLTFESWPASALHFTTCTRRPERSTKRPRAHA